MSRSTDGILNGSMKYPLLGQRSLRSLADLSLISHETERERESAYASYNFQNFIFTSLRVCMCVSRMCGETKITRVLAFHVYTVADSACYRSLLHLSRHNGSPFCSRPFEARVIPTRFFSSFLPNAANERTLDSDILRSS